MFADITDISGQDDSIGIKYETYGFMELSKVCWIIVPVSSNSTNLILVVTVQNDDNNLKYDSGKWTWII